MTPDAGRTSSDRGSGSAGQNQLPFPPASSVLGKKRPLQGKLAHTFVSNGKSRRLEEQTHAAYLELAGNAKPKVRSSKQASPAAGAQSMVGGPRPARPLPRPPSPDAGPSRSVNPAPLGRQHSFKVNPQPARPHNIQTIRREPSFTVEPQPPIHVQAVGTGKAREHRRQEQVYPHDTVREEETRKQAMLAEEARQQALAVHYPGASEEETARQEAIRAEKARLQVLLEEQAHFQALKAQRHQQALFEEQARQQALRDEMFHKAVTQGALRWQTLREEETRRQELYVQDLKRQRALREEETRQRALYDEDVRRQAARNRTRQEHQDDPGDPRQPTALNEAWVPEHHFEQLSQEQQRLEDQEEEAFIQGHLEGVEDDSEMVVDDVDPLPPPDVSPLAVVVHEVSRPSSFSEPPLGEPSWDAFEPTLCFPSPEVFASASPPSSTPSKLTRLAAAAPQPVSISPEPTNGAPSPPPPVSVPSGSETSPTSPNPADHWQAPSPPLSTPPKPITRVSSLSTPEPSEYRVPSPTFDHGTSPSPTKETPSAQFMALLLQQSQQLTQLMQTLVSQNQDLRSVLTDQFSELNARLSVIETTASKSTHHPGRNGVDHEEEHEEEMNIEVEGDDELEETPKVRSRKKAQKTSLLKDPQLKEGLKALQTCVRLHLFTLCDVSSVPELIQKNPPITDEEILSFEEGEDDMLTCSVQSFRVDFVRPWKDPKNPNSFNALANDVFIKSLIKMYRGGGYSDYTIPEKLLAEKVIDAVLDKHMEYRRKQYRRHLKPLSKEEQDRIRQRKAMNARKYTLRDNRVFVILTFKLNRHKRLFSMLRPIHMSGDETDGPEKTHPPTFRIVQARWQSLAFKLFLRALDALYRECWAHPTGSRATSGNPPRIRVERQDGRTEDSVAPVGLWRNCYDQEWLKSLRPHVLESLNIIDQDYDFSLPAAKAAK